MGDELKDAGLDRSRDTGLLETLLENTPDYVYFKDKERRYVRASRPFETLLGRTQDEIVGQRDEDLFPQEVAMEGANDDLRVIEEGAALVNKLEGTEDPSGKMVWVLTTKVPWHDVDGNIQGLFGISRDITDHVMAEDSFKAETEMTNAALDAQLDTFFVFEPGTGRAVRWNRAFREVSGYTDEEISELPAPASYYSPEDLERANAFMTYVMEHEYGTIELQLICKDGNRIPTEYRVSVLRDENDDPRYLISIGRDISERKQSNEALRVQRERLARFMDSATDSFHLLDSELRLIDINERALSRIREVDNRVRSKESVVGRSLLDIYPFLRGSDEEARLRKVLKTKQPDNYDTFAEHPVHGTVYMAVKIFMVDEGLGLIATDISDRKHAEEQRLDLERQVQHSQKLESLGVLAGGIAHDFNNILVSIRGYADLALQELSAGAAERDYIEEVIVGAQRATELANQMLAYSGKGPSEVQPIDLNEIVEEMAGLLQVSTSKKSVLKYDLADNLPAIDGDSTQVRQVIMNLITNASESIGDESGVITVSTSMARHHGAETADGAVAQTESDCVCLEVSDTGCGMDEATRQKMFEPFYTTKFAGRGLGMAAVYGIVRGHGGSIDVRSEVDEGTSIKVLFPVSASRASEESESSSSDLPTEDSWTGTGTALVVDDEESVRKLAKTMIELMGFEVLEAADGHEAIEVFQGNLDTVRFVILDLTMPRMDGEECFHALCKLKSDVRVILSSGYSEQEITERLADLSIRGFIQKPYGFDTMKAKIREALAD